MKPLRQSGPNVSAIIICMLVMVLTASSVTAADLQNVYQMPLNSHIEFLEDPSTNRDLSSVRHRDDWQQQGEGAFNQGYSDSAWWLRFTLTNDADTGIERLLSLEYPVLGDVQVHVVSDRNDRQFHQLGHNYPYNQRPVDHRFFVIPLEWQPGETLSVYMRVRSQTSVQVPATLWERDTFRSHDMTANILQGIYFGAFLVIAVYNLLLYFALGERNYLYYVGFVMSMALLMASLTGYGFRHLWPGATVWNDQAILVFISGILGFAGLFIRRFLELSRISVMLDRLALAFVVVSAVCVVLAFYLSYFTLIAVLIPLVVAGCIFAFLGGIYAWGQGQATAKYFVMAWTFILAGGSILALSKGGVLPSNFFTDHAAQLGSMIEVVLLSFALAQRINVERQLRYQAQSETLETARRLNRELEERVQERTQELEKLNEKLNELSVTDELTGLRNRRFLDQQLEQEVGRAWRSGSSLAVAMLDIDHFKPVNDTYGHQVGDACLRMVGEILRGSLRSPSDTGARYGGEEFALILPDTDCEEALAVVERVRARIHATRVESDGVVLELTLSAGVTAHPVNESVTPDQFLVEADEALYRAKETGRNRVCAYGDQAQS
ncbi:diguanylate cyclase [Halospina denitrificans]|uniref:diguanylate cyclase n=2 Tax=Halospina denitrificans TaxID=332522 RepID=A0A4R7JY06_9GAMM|nr:diguanylate cyclase [Halospina denitrificans]